MNKVELIKIDTPSNYNVGQRAEYVARYTLTGMKMRADNKAHTECADVDNIQIKSTRATVCVGNDLDKYLDNDKATAWGYVDKECNALYIMNRAEYTEFVRVFGLHDRQSTKNGGRETIRLSKSNTQMVKWLESLN